MHLGGAEEACRAGGQFLGGAVESGQDGRVRAGTGLGLTIALAIVEAHRGTIGVVKSDHEGTTFRISLPLWAG